ncbi:hypothetical protein FA13DRAFT_1326115 [Coprinellus micaceus]|uniref:Uncharacterized protein n=1 Tax=Coprinellus micaceus TaxID=71717 RepID=A0A4Y7SR55_COPMI|nr:hypothetical protein FA13DRAFT_1326115 [Coprinellus micaceus]
MYSFSLSDSVDTGGRLFWSSVLLSSTFAPLVDTCRLGRYLGFPGRIFGAFTRALSLNSRSLSGSIGTFSSILSSESDAPEGHSPSIGVRTELGVPREGPVSLVLFISGKIGWTVRCAFSCWPFRKPKL